MPHKPHEKFKKSAKKRVAHSEAKNELTRVDIKAPDVIMKSTIDTHADYRYLIQQQF